MSINLFLSQPKTLFLQTLKNATKCCYATAAKNSIIAELDVQEVPAFEQEFEQPQDQELEKMRNKSRLEPQHHNMLHGQKPYDQVHANFHNTVQYKRKLIGRYGIAAAEVTPAICWPTEKDLEDVKEYESLAYPIPIQDVWKKIEERKRQEALEIKTREEEIDKVVANFDKWRTNLEAKIAKKEAQLLEAKQKKEELLEEIRAEVGYNIKPNDQKFKEIMELKELEDKKRKKALKKQQRSEKLLNYIQKVQATEQKESGNNNEEKENNSESSEKKTK